MRTCNSALLFPKRKIPSTPSQSDTLPRPREFFHQNAATQDPSKTKQSDFHRQAMPHSDCPLHAKCPLSILKWRSPFSGTLSRLDRLTLAHKQHVSAKFFESNRNQILLSKANRKWQTHDPTKSIADLHFLESAIVAAVENHRKSFRYSPKIRHWYCVAAIVQNFLTV